MTLVQSQGFLYDVSHVQGDEKIQNIIAEYRARMVRN